MPVSRSFRGTEIRGLTLECRLAIKVKFIRRTMEFSREVKLSEFNVNFISHRVNTIEALDATDQNTVLRSISGAMAAGLSSTTIHLPMAYHFRIGFPITGTAR